MRKLAMLGVLGAALAWNARADDTQEKKQEAQTELQKKEAEARKDAAEGKAEAHEDAAKAQAKANEKTSEAQQDAAKSQAKADEKVGEARKDAAEKTNEAERQGTASGTESHTYGTDPSADPNRAAASGDMGRTSMGGDMGHKHPVFTKDNFDLDGKIQSATASSITITREELPAVKLNIDKNTKIELDGDKVSAAQLRPGQDVKASFNLRNDKPIAVEIKADKKK